MSDSAYDPEDDLNFPLLNLYGDFIDRTTVVHGSTMSLLFGVGEISDTDRKVLVPFIDLRVDGVAPNNENDGIFTKGETADVEARALFSRTMTLENLVYMVSDLASELNVISGQLATVSEGGLKMEDMRVKKCIEWLKETQQVIGRSVTQFDAIIENGKPRS